MRAVSLICGSVLIVYGAGLAGFTNLPLDAGQSKPKPPPPPKPVKAPAAKPANAAAPRTVPADQLQKMLNMSPEDREKSLSKLPPAQRKNVENRLNTLDKMNPQQRERQLELTRRLEKLPPARQQAVTQEMQSINKLPQGPERRAAIQSPDFQKNFSPEEQQLIRDRFFPNAAK